MAKPNNSNIELKLSEQALYLEYALSYGINLKDRIIRITDEITPWTVDIVDTAVQEMERDNRTGITVKICSAGGETYAALAIVDILQAAKSQIITVGIGNVFSAASLILACGDKRKIGAHAHVMHHESSFGIEGRQSDIQDYLIQAAREEEVWAEAMAKFTGYGSKEFWIERGKKTDWYLNADEAIMYGIADEIL